MCINIFSFFFKYSLDKKKHGSMLHMIQIWYKARISFRISAYYFRLACFFISLAGNSLFLLKFSKTSLHVNERNVNKCEWADGTRRWWPREFVPALFANLD